MNQLPDQEQFQEQVKKELGISSSDDMSTICASGDLFRLYLITENWGVSKNGDCIDQAVENGKLSVVQYLLQWGQVPSLPSVREAIRKGQLRVIEYLHTVGYPITGELLQTAVESNLYYMVDYYVRAEAPITEQAVDAAILKGNQRIMELLITFGGQPSSMSLTLAATSGNLEILQYLIDRGLRFDIYSTTALLQHNSISLIESVQEMTPLVLDERNLYQAISLKSLTLFEWIRDHGVQPNLSHLNLAVSLNVRPIIDLLTRIGIHPTTETIRYALIQEHIELARDLVQRFHLDISLLLLPSSLYQYLMSLAGQQVGPMINSDEDQRIESLKDVPEKISESFYPDESIL